MKTADFVINPMPNRKTHTGKGRSLNVLQETTVKK